MIPEIAIIEIPDDNGEGYRLRILRAHDGDLHFSVVQGTERVTRRSVRVCESAGQPRHREIYRHLLKAFAAAEQLGYRVDE